MINGIYSHAKPSVMGRRRAPPHTHIHKQTAFSSQRTPSGFRLRHWSSVSRLAFLVLSKSNVSSPHRAWNTPTGRAPPPLPPLKPIHRKLFLLAFFDFCALNEEEHYSSTTHCLGASLARSRRVRNRRLHARSNHRQVRCATRFNRAYILGRANNQTHHRTGAIACSVEKVYRQNTGNLEDVTDARRKLLREQRRTTCAAWRRRRRHCR